MNEASPTRTDNPEETRDPTGISYATNCATASVLIKIIKIKLMNPTPDFGRGRSTRATPRENGHRLLTEEKGQTQDDGG